MNSSVLLCILLSVVSTSMVASMVVPAEDNDINLLEDSFEVNVHQRGTDLGSSVQESIVASFKHNYVRVTTPTIVLIHDYNVGMTLMRSNDSCFLLNEYKDIPAKLDDWFNLERNAVGGVLEADPANKTYHHYMATSIYVNSTTLPAVMQQECGAVEIAVLEETIRRATDTDTFGGPGKVSGTVYLPSICMGKHAGGEGKGRQKRHGRESRRKIKCNNCGICGVDFGRPAITPFGTIRTIRMK